MTRRSATRARLVAGAVSAGVFAAATAAARAEELNHHERRTFRQLNQLPSAAGLPLGAVMQAGNALAIPLVAGALWRHGAPSRAAAAAGAGTAAWLGAKGVKHAIARGRPTAHLAEVTVRGRPQSGLGYPSGHAAVSVALAATAAGALPAPVRPVAGGVALATMVARVHVGAHLPLDVIGGAALGLLLAAVASGTADAVYHRDGPSTRDPDDPDDGA